MRTVDFYEVVSLVAEAVEKTLMDGKHISKARMEELKFCCNALEKIADELEAEGFWADYDETKEEFLLGLEGEYFEISGAEDPALGVMEKASSFSLSAGEGTVEICFCIRALDQAVS